MVLNNLAWAMAQLKDPKALEYAEKANELAPNSPAIMDTLGVLLVEKGETHAGVELLRKAVERAPEAAGHPPQSRAALIKAGQKDAAKKELEALAKLGDKYPAGRVKAMQLLKARPACCSGQLCAVR